MRESRMMRKYQVRFGERSRETRSLRDEKVRSAPTRLSPILSNIYLDRLDQYVEDALIPAYTKGERREANDEYNALICRVYRLRRKGQIEEAKALRKQAQQMPSQNPEDPNYRRLRYVRYADDVRHLTH